MLIFWIQKLRPCISGISADCSGIIFDQLKFLKYHNNKKEKHTVYKNKNGVLKGFSFVPHQKYSENGASLRVFCCLFSSLSISYFIWKKNKRGRRLNNNYFFTHLTPHKLLDVYWWILLPLCYSWMDEIHFFYVHISNGAGLRLPCCLFSSSSLSYFSWKHKQDRRQLYLSS